MRSPSRESQCNMQESLKSSKNICASCKLSRRYVGTICQAHRSNMSYEVFKNIRAYIWSIFHVVITNKTISFAKCCCSMLFYKDLFSFQSPVVQSLRFIKLFLHYCAIRFMNVWLRKTLMQSFFYLVSHVSQNLWHQIMQNPLFNGSLANFNGIFRSVGLLHPCNLISG